MGWVSYHVGYGFNKKDEIDKIYTWSEGSHEVSVLKSAMIGSTYYAAIRVKDGDEESITAVVVLSRVDNENWDNFAYKAMDETMGPVQCDCPIGILNLLTQIDSKWANEWREKCRKNHENKKSPTALSKLPYDSEIEFEWCGNKVRVRKQRPSYQFKTAWWKVCGENHYWSKKRIPHDYRVVTLGAE